MAKHNQLTSLPFKGLTEFDMRCCQTLSL